MAALVSYRPPPLGWHPRVTNASLAGQDQNGLTREQFNTIVSRLGLGDIDDRDMLKVYLLNFNSIRSHFRESSAFDIQS